MTFFARGGRALADIEADLTRSDPGLAAQFKRFNNWCRRGPDEQVRQPRRQVRLMKLVPLLLLPLAVLLLSWCAVTGGGHGSTRGCAMVAITKCPASRSPAELRARKLGSLER
jgi:hypothetical protein